MLPNPFHNELPLNRNPRRAPDPYTEIANNKNTRARKEGHFIIGALFPLHQAPTQKTAYSRQCGEIREYYGIQRVEAFLMTLKKINDDKTILPKINLGWDIRDSCWYSAIALENSIDFIKDAIAGQSQTNNKKQKQQQQKQQQQQQERDDFLPSPTVHTNVGKVSTDMNSTRDTMTSSTDRKWKYKTPPKNSDVDDDNDDDDGDGDGDVDKQSHRSHSAWIFPPSNLEAWSGVSGNATKSQATSGTSGGGNLTSVFGDKERRQCKSEETRMKPIVGLVGPGSSEATIQVQNLLQIFNIPQIGYSATSIDLSDKSHYNYFLRVVPPDRHQAQALVDVVVKFNWTYISTVHSDGNYGVRGMEKFVDLATEKGLCIATSDNVASSAGDADFDKVLDNLLKVPNATVVVCFCEGMTVKKLLMATHRRGLEGRFLIVGSDGWGNRLDVVQGHELAALGALSIKLYSPPVVDFLPHYSKLRPDEPTDNPWFHSFWQQRFKCSLDPLRRDVRGFERFCTGNETLAGSDQDSKLGFVVKAVETMARALHAMHQDLCPGVEGLCPAMEPIKGSVYLDYLLNVSFLSYSKELVHFDASGDPPGRYEILNYQKIIAADGNVSYDYVTIGRWTTGVLKLNGRPVHWPRLYHGEVKSVCSEPCAWGQAKKVKGVACCWICTTCLDNQILIENNTDCRPCDLGYWPNANKTDCEQIVIDFINWHSTEAIVCVTVGCIGILCTMWVAAIFVRFHDTPVVKASTRELSYIILAGIALAFSANFFIVAKPEQGVCYLTRIFPGLSFSLIYGALVTKTNRIARILEGSKRISTKKPRFMSATAQVMITIIIIGIECAVIVAMLIYQPANSKLDYPGPRRVRLVCDTSTLGIVVPLGFDLVLILLCTIYAVKTRNLPENFNEAKFIGFTMYATCIIWSGFFPIYFAGENKEVTLSFSVSLSAAIALLLLFVPKVYVIVWVPEKNTRGAFTTSRDVRCHIGSKSLASGDSIDIKESSTFENLFKADKGQNKGWKQKSLDEKRLRFVMQRASRSDSTSSYINHGVIRKHTLLGSCSTIIKEPSRDSARTDSTHVSGISSSCSEKDRMFSGGESVRQMLASEFRPPRKQSSLRPDSPAEKEKHRIHNVENMPDYCLAGVGGLVGASTIGGAIGGGLGRGQGLSASSKNQQVPRSSQFRKSLSSNCVSMDYKTRSIHCQTDDELLQCLLPGLRRRCLSKGKHILERSTAVDASGHDETVSGSSRQHPVTFTKQSTRPSALSRYNKDDIESVACPKHPDVSPCHCHVDLSDLSPLVFEQHPDTNSSRYRKKNSKSKTASSNPCYLLNVKNLSDCKPSQCSHSLLEFGNSAAPCNTSLIETIPRPPEPSPRLPHNCLSPSGLQCTSGLTPSPERTTTILTPSSSPNPGISPDALNACSTVTKYHCDNPSNHFKVIRTSDIEPHHHCCYNRPHHPYHHHHNHLQQQQHHHPHPPNLPQNTTTTTPCGCHNPHQPPTSPSLHALPSSSVCGAVEHPPGPHANLEPSPHHPSPLSPSQYPYPPSYQHLDSNSDSHTTLSTASSSFTLPPFNTSTDSNHSNHSVFSDTGSDHDGDEDGITNKTTNNRSNSSFDDIKDEDNDDSDDVIDDHGIVNEFTPLKEKSGDDDCDDDNDDEGDDGGKHSGGVIPLSSAMAGGDDVMEFQNYLQSRGINLEISSEQCSEL